MIICTFLPAKAQHCFCGKPLPECKTFWITEFGYSHRLDQQPRRYQFAASNFYLTWEVGMTGNLNQKSALGATFMLGADDNGHRFGVKPRYRWSAQNQGGQKPTSPGTLARSSAHIPA